MLSRFASLLFTPAFLSAQLPFLQNSQPEFKQQLTMFAKPSVVRVIVDCSGQYTDHTTGRRYPYDYGAEPNESGSVKVGTGFFISTDGFIVTNAHMVNDAAGSEKRCRDILKNNIKTDMREQGLTDQLIEDLLSSNKLELSQFSYYQHVVLPNAIASSNPMIPFEIKEQGRSSNEDSKDIAVVKIAVTNAPVLKLATTNSVPPESQDKIIVIGYPGAADNLQSLSDESLVEATITEGIVSNPYKMFEDRSPVIQLDVRVEPGSSGSPVLNERGEVIGVVALRGVNSEGGSIPFAVPTSTIWEFVRASGAVNEQATTDRLYQEGLKLYWKGDYQGAKTKFEAVTSLFPEHSEANRLIRESEQHIADAWGSRQYTLWFLVAGLSALVLVLAYLLTRRRSPQPALVAESPSPSPSLVDAPTPDPKPAQPPRWPQTITRAFRPATVMSSQPFLELRNQQGVTKRFYLHDRTHQLGRDRDWADLEISDEGWEVVSKHHAVLTREGQHYRIYDGDGKQPSTNGIWVNGSRVQQDGYLLHDEDQLVIGNDPINQVVMTYFNPHSRDSSAQNGTNRNGIHPEGPRSSEVRQ